MTYHRITAELRKAVSEWVALGCSVEMRPDGALVIKPKAEETADEFADVKRKK